MSILPGNFTSSANNSKQLNMYVSQAYNEEILYRKCRWAVKHAQDSINALMKLNKYSECIPLKHLRNIAQSYLDSVTPEDIAYVQNKDNKEREAKAASWSKASSGGVQRKDAESTPNRTCSPTEADKSSPDSAMEWNRILTLRRTQRTKNGTRRSMR